MQQSLMMGTSFLRKQVIRIGVRLDPEALCITADETRLTAFRQELQEPLFCRGCRSCSAVMSEKLYIRKRARALFQTG